MKIGETWRIKPEHKEEIRDYFEETGEGWDFDESAGEIIIKSFNDRSVTYIDARGGIANPKWVDTEPLDMFLEDYEKVYGEDQ